MPFTPFHLGPGVLFKAIGGRHFSFMLFAASQVAMDVEPLVRMLRGDTVLHGFTHSYAGATLVGIGSLVMGRPMCEYLLRRWNRYYGTKGFAVDRRIPLGAALSGVTLGVYSHVLFDSFLYWDMSPLAPFSDANGLLYDVSHAAMYGFCAVTALVGAAGIAWQRRRGGGE